MTKAQTNTRWVVARHPGEKLDLADFRREEVPISELKEGQILVRTLYLSLDPHHAMLMRPPGDTFGVRQGELSSVLTPIAVGETIKGAGVGEVVVSRDARFAPGDLVEGYLGYQTHVICGGYGTEVASIVPMSTEAFAGAQSDTLVQKYDAGGTPPYMRLSVLGEQGLTAHVGLIEVGRPRPGETVFVTNAAGSCGQVVAQVAKLMGCRVIGSAGPEHKVRFLTEELKLDGAVSYRDPDAAAKIDELCPDGIDVFVDLAGGAFADLVFSRLTFRGRMAIIGTIADWWSDESLPENRMARPWWSINLKQIRVEGFVLWDYAHLYEAYMRQLRRWWINGDLISKEDILDGIDAAPQGLIDVLGGGNFGKAIVRISEASAPSS